MGFPNYESEIEIVVTHQWHPDSQFIFTFPKKLPQAALDAEAAFLGLTDDERSEKARVMMIQTVAQMASKAPQGFEGFPADVPLPDLPKAIKDYFDDPDQPELETIITTAWTGWRAAARPAAYSKSLSRDGKGDGQPPGAAAKAPSG